MCGRTRHKSAWTGAESDQSLHCPHEEIGADPGFLERGFIYITVCVGFALLMLSNFS